MRGSSDPKIGAAMAAGRRASSLPRVDVTQSDMMSTLGGIMNDADCCSSRIGDGQRMNFAPTICLAANTTSDEERSN